MSLKLNSLNCYSSCKYYRWMDLLELNPPPPHTHTTPIHPKRMESLFFSSKLKLWKKPFVIGSLFSIRSTNQMGTPSKVQITRHSSYQILKKITRVKKGRFWNQIFTLLLGLARYKASNLTAWRGVGADASISLITSCNEKKNKTLTSKHKKN